MSTITKKGERGARWSFLDRRCIGRPCFAPGTYQHRGATLSGSRNTGAVSLTCMARAYHGCPAGPEGEHKENCTCIDHEGAIDPNCKCCNGTGKVTIQGVQEFDKKLEAQRKAEGWKSL